MTHLDAIETAYDAAADQWTGADWTHEARIGGTVVMTAETVDEDGNIVEHAHTVYCDGDYDDCSLCAEAKSSAASAEEYAAEALSDAKAGRWHQAVQNAQQASGLESEYGDNPTWRAFCEAVESAEACGSA